MTHEEEGVVLTALSECACATTGFSRESILPQALRRVLRDETEAGATTAAIIERARGRETSLAHALAQAVSVGETYFFRHPEQFELVAREFAGRAKAFPVTAWSAGCATGEESYSIAACLRAALPDAPVSVLGTDLLERNVASARVARFGRWSIRPSAPVPPALFEPPEDNKVRVVESIRRLVAFEQHNLLGAPPSPGLFDLVMCRNVLVYLDGESQRRVVAGLASALAPGGLVVFGPMDVSAAPPGLVRIGGAELQTFRRPREHEEAAAPAAVRRPPSPPVSVHALPKSSVISHTYKPKPPPSVPPPCAPAPSAIEPVALHLRALALIENGDDRAAATLLDDLCRRAPDYVPGLIERALVHVRAFELALASFLMREVIRLTARLGPDEEIPGPEPLPARFYVGSAEAFLERLDGAHR